MRRSVAYTVVSSSRGSVTRRRAPPRNTAWPCHVGRVKNDRDAVEVAASGAPSDRNRGSPHPWSPATKVVVRGGKPEGRPAPASESSSNRRQPFALAESEQPNPSRRWPPSIALLTSRTSGVTAQLRTRRHRGCLVASTRSGAAEDGVGFSVDLQGREPSRGCSGAHHDTHHPRSHSCSVRS
jgi:hypothetical protein